MSLSFPFVSLLDWCNWSKPSFCNAGIHCLPLCWLSYLSRVLRVQALCGMGTVSLPWALPFAKSPSSSSVPSGWLPSGMSAPMFYSALLPFTRVSSCGILPSTLFGVGDGGGKVPTTSALYWLQIHQSFVHGFIYSLVACMGSPSSRASGCNAVCL